MLIYRLLLDPNAANVLQFVLDSLAMQIKTGVIVTPAMGIEKSIAYEVVEKGGWSLDIGATQTQGFLGVGKDVIDTKKLEVDIGAGMTTKEQGYVGVHFRF